VKKEREILVNFDGKEKKLKNRLKPDEEVGASESMDDDYPLQNDKQKIVDFNKRRQAIEESRAPFWDDGKSGRSPKLPPSNRKKKKPVQTFDFFKNQLFLSIISAILVGGAFGMMLLSLFTGNDTSSGQIESEIADGTSVVDMGEGNDSLGASLSPHNFHIVQAGAFSTVEVGDEMANVLKAKGFPARLWEEDGTHYLFVGMALDREGADVLAKRIGESGHETYVKPFEIPTDRVEVDQDLHTFLTKGIEWMELASEIAINDIAKGPPSNIEMTNVFEAAESWQKSSEDLSVSDENVEHLLSEWLEESQSVMSVYSSNVSSANFAWDLQESLLNGMLNYMDLINVLEKNNLSLN